MKLAIASGKGGTGKTTVATNLAVVAAEAGPVAYLDCDVEEPNGAIFLKPTILDVQPVHARVPSVDSNACTGCGLCGRICQYSAIVALGATPLTFPELCHACGGCSRVCPVNAIHEVDRPIGQLHRGEAGEVQFVQGLLDIGQAMSPPVIRAVKQAAPSADLIISDCPPGTSCPAIEAMRSSDYVLLVTEPTPFGLNDLRLAVETVRQLHLPFGVVINRADAGDDATRRYCEAEDIAILAETPDERAVARGYSRGQLAVEVSAAFRSAMERVLSQLKIPGGSA